MYFNLGPDMQAWKEDSILNMFSSMKYVVFLRISFFFGAYICNNNMNNICSKRVISAA